MVMDGNIDRVHNKLLPSMAFLVEKEGEYGREGWREGERGREGVEKEGQRKRKIVFRMNQGY